MTKEDFPGRYMYRDIGLKYWEATHTWVKEYLSVCRLYLFLYLITRFPLSVVLGWFVFYLLL